MASRARDTSIKGHKKDTLPGSSATPTRTGTPTLADELSEAADVANWPRMPGLQEFVAMASHITISGY